MSADESERSSKDDVSKAGEALIGSLRGLVRAELVAEGFSLRSEDENVALGPWQIIVIIAFAVDVALIYVYFTSVIPGAKENRVVAFLAELLPFVGGTLLISYLEKIRRWILGLSTRPKWGIACLVFVPVLLFFQAPIYSLYVTLDPKNADVQLDQKEARFSDASTREYLLLDKPLACRIRVTDGNASAEYPISPLQVISGTLARVPVIDVAFKQLQLSVLYDVKIRSPEEDGIVQIRAPDNFAMRNSELAREADKGSSSKYLWTKGITTSSTLVRLPRGTYDFILQSTECNTETDGMVIDKDHTIVDFHKNCLDIK